MGRKYKCLADLVTDYNEEHNGLVTALKYPVPVEHNPNDDDDEKDSDEDDDDEECELGAICFGVSVADVVHILPNKAFVVIAVDDV